MKVKAVGSVRIADRVIGPESPPFIVAEMSGNHNQNLDRALEIVEAAARAGAHAIKLQTYTADTMTLKLSDRDFLIEDPKSLWRGRTLYELYEEAHTPWEWHESLFERARELGLVPFSAPFDSTAVDFLEELGSPAYKIASFEIVDLPLIEKVASTGKPLVISTGMATLTEIAEAVSAARKGGCKGLILLQCTSTYPASPESSDLRTIPNMQDAFGVPVGLSDHTLGIGVAVASVALGAVLIEKHLTLDRGEGGVDSAFSLEPHEMRMLVAESERSWQSMGQVRYGPSNAEVASKQFRRSLYIVEDIEPGGELTEKNVRSIRPGYGLSPALYSQVLGLRVSAGAKAGTALTWELLAGTQ